MASLSIGSIQIGALAGSIGTNRLYVNNATGNDSNSGLMFSSPLKTIGAAIAKSVSNTEIWVSGGTYAEGVVIADIDKLRLIGESRDGTNTVFVEPPAGTKALDVAAQEFEALGIAFIGSNTDVIEISGVNNKLTNLYVETNANGARGVIANDADALIIDDLYADGNNKVNNIGVLFTGDTVDAIIQNSYLTGWGSGAGLGANLGYAIGRNEACQRISVIKNRIISNWIGEYWYAPVGPTAIEGDTVIGNICMENQSYDFWDNNDWPDSANLIDRNFYGYATGSDNWFDDIDGDLIADFVVKCGLSNYDKHPMPSPSAWRSESGYARMGLK
jgi:hypothetical protein